MYGQRPTPKPPVLFSLKTTDGDHADQREFSIDTYNPDFGEIGDMIDPSATFGINRFAVRERAIFSESADLGKRWDKLPIVVSVNKPQTVDQRKVTWCYALNYAMNNEMSQLVDFIRFEDTLNHQRQMAEVGRTLEECRSLNKDLRSYVHALELHLEDAQRPWYKRLWNLLASRLEP